MTNREAADLLIKGENVNKRLKDRQIITYLDNRLDFR